MPNKGLYAGLERRKRLDRRMIGIEYAEKEVSRTYEFPMTEEKLLALHRSCELSEIEGVSDVGFWGEHMSIVLTVETNKLNSVHDKILKVIEETK